MIPVRGNCAAADFRGAGDSVARNCRTLIQWNSVCGRYCMQGNLGLVCMQVGLIRGESCNFGRAALRRLNHKLLRL